MDVVAEGQASHDSSYRFKRMAGVRNIKKYGRAYRKAFWPHLLPTAECDASSPEAGGSATDKRGKCRSAHAMWQSKTSQSILEVFSSAVPSRTALTVSKRCPQRRQRLGCATLRHSVARHCPAAPQLSDSHVYTAIWR